MKTVLFLSVKKILYALLFEVFIIGSGFTQTTVTFYPGNDTYPSPYNEFFWTGYVTDSYDNKSRDEIGVGKPSLSKARRGLIFFDVSNLPENAIIEDVKLKLYPFNPGGANHTLEIYYLSSLPYGYAGELYWSDCNSGNKYYSGNSLANVSNKWVTITLNSLSYSDLESDRGVDDILWFGIGLCELGDNDNNSRIYGYSNATYRPRLEVRYNLSVSVPSKPTNPSPSNGATNQSRNVDLSWSNGGGATSYKVYFGTDSSPDSGELQGTQSGTSFTLGTLSYSTTYYWRIDAVNSGGTTTGDVWRFTTEAEPISVPSKPTNPSPSNGATNQSRNVDLSWSNGGGATSYKVYFGTDSSPDSGELQGTQSGTSFTLGTLSYSTTYYWRIDAVNSGGTTTGDVWRFTTEAEPVSAPSKPTNPNPSNGATNQSRNVDLSWSNGGGATSYKVYFGTDSSPDSGELQGTQSGTSFTLGTLSYSTTYYWRIDAVNSGGTTTGDVWRFTTEAEPVSAPSKPTNPNPSNGATNQSRNVDLSWSNGGGATSYKVYFGTDSSPDSGELQGTQSGTSFTLGTLSYSTTYYWRIDAVNSGGTTTGDVWRFTTEAEPVSAPSKPTNPNPSNGATNQSRNVDLSWSNGGGATSYKVYFGTDSSPDSGELQGTQSGTSFTLGTLSYSTTYYWRIDAVNSGGTTTGDVWRFTTEAKPVSSNHPPNNPILTSPQNGETVSLPLTLSWSGVDPDGDDLTYRIYLGTSSANMSGWMTTNSEYYNVYALNPGTYYWRVRSYDGKEWSDYSSYRKFTIPSNSSNNPPNKPVITSPKYDEVVPLVLSSSNHKIFKIEWTCSDPEGDALSYVVCIGRSEIGLENANQHKTTNNSISLYFSNPDYNYTGVWYCCVLATDGGDTIASDVTRFHLDWPTSAERVGLDRQIKVYPNPTDNQLAIEFSQIPKEYLIELYNNLGQLVVQKQSTNQLETLNLEKLPGGIYYLKLFNKEFTKTEKVVVR